MINKRGGVLHWIVFGIIGALGLFLYFALHAPGLQTVKGEWQQGLFYDGFFPAELRLLEQEVRLQHLFRETAIELASSGGFATGSSCEKIEGKNINIWDEECFPNIREEFQKLFVLRLDNEEYRQYGFSEVTSEVTFNENYLVGKSAYLFQPSQLGKQPPSSVLQYSVSAGFSFDASPLEEAYSKVSSEAGKLLQKCRNERDATACITSEKSVEKLNLLHWKYASCVEEKEFPVGERILSFCVQEGIFSFQFALDFTPDEPFAVENLEVLYVLSKNGYELHFSSDKFAESYKVYYTDFLDFVKTKGSAEEVFQQVMAFQQVGSVFLEEKLISESEVQKDCPVEKKKGIAYLCADEIVYLVDDSRLTVDDDYVFWVTTISGGKESGVLFLMKIEDLFAKEI